LKRRSLAGFNAPNDIKTTPDAVISMTGQAMAEAKPITAAKNAEIETQKFNKAFAAGLAEVLEERNYDAQRDAKQNRREVKADSDLTELGRKIGQFINRGE
jgi:hypothetical protein